MNVYYVECLQNNVFEKCKNKENKQQNLKVKTKKIENYYRENCLIQNITDSFTI